jgi:hypothetical protein
VVIEGQLLQAVAARFRFGYGTLHNVVAPFRACSRQGQTPSFFRLDSARAACR